MPYTKLYHCGKVQVFGDVPPSENNPKGVGCYLSLTGGGCREFFDIYCHELWEENLARRNYGMFFASCNQRQRFDYRGYEYLSYHVTRLDIAIDDFNEKPFFTPQQLYRKCLKGEVVSASRTFGGSEKGTAEDGLGKTLYIGDGSSNLSYRVYDKDVQQFQRYGTALEEVGSWKRCELQLRDETANGFAQLMAKEPDYLGKQVFDILGSSLRFVVPDGKESNKSRWQTCRFWKRFLGAIQPLKITIPQPESSLQDTQRWLRDGGPLAAVKAFLLLEDCGALGELETVEDLMRELKFSQSLSAKVSSHLYSIGREELIPRLKPFTAVE